MCTTQRVSLSATVAMNLPLPETASERTLRRWLPRSQ